MGASILAQNYAGKFVLGHYVFLKVHSFLPAGLSENLSLFKTDNISEKYPCIFLHQIEAIVYISLLFTLNLHEAKLICYKIEAFDLNRKGPLNHPHPLSLLACLGTLGFTTGCDQRTRKPN